MLQKTSGLHFSSKTFLAGKLCLVKTKAHIEISAWTTSQAKGSKSTSLCVKNKVDIEPLACEDVIDRHLCYLAAKWVSMTCKSYNPRAKSSPWNSEGESSENIL